MDIIINGKLKKVKSNTTVIELLKFEGYSHWVGVWVNNIQLLQKEYTDYKLKKNDEIKIIRPLGGG